VAFVRDLGDLAIVTPGQLRLSVIREDPDDDRYLECAVEGHAEYIVSGDRHLLALGTYRDIAIMSPRVFLAALPAARSR
jgi:predicted nucleic acid-binding protein